VSNLQLSDLLLRFIAGGAIISTFALVGDLFKPRSFSGIFSAAPSLAVTTIGLALFREGALYASTESRSMILGAAAFFVYAYATCYILMHYKVSALVASTASIVIWLGISMLLWAVCLR